MAGLGRISRDVDCRHETPSQGTAEAMAKISEIVLDGLRHGFFEMNLSCEIDGGKRRVLTIRSGKSYRYNIPVDQISGVESRKSVTPETGAPQPDHRRRSPSV